MTSSRPTVTAPAHVGAPCATCDPSSPPRRWPRWRWWRWAAPAAAGSSTRPGPAPALRPPWSRLRARPAPWSPPPRRRQRPRCPSPSRSRRIPTRRHPRSCWDASPSPPSGSTSHSRRASRSRPSTAVPGIGPAHPYPASSGTWSSRGTAPRTRSPSTASTSWWRATRWCSRTRPGCSAGCTRSGKGSASQRIVAKLRLLDERGRPVDDEAALPPLDVGLRPTDDTLVVRGYPEGEAPANGLGDPFGQTAS